MQIESELAKPVDIKIQIHLHKIYRVRGRELSLRDPFQVANITCQSTDIWPRRAPIPFHTPLSRLKVGDGDTVVKTMREQVRMMSVHIEGGHQREQNLSKQINSVSLGRLMPRTA